MLSLNNIDLLQRARNVRSLVLDVDGVLTDGKLYFLADGSEAKAFSTLDGQGIKMLMNSGSQGCHHHWTHFNDCRAPRGKSRHHAPDTRPRRQTYGLRRITEFSATFL